MTLLLDVAEETAAPGRSSRNLREVHLDFLLLEEFETNLGFAREVFEIAFLGEALPAGPPHSVRARHSVWDAGGEGCPVEACGENDLDITATWEAGIERRLIVEDKLRAGFQINQALRYRARAASRAPHSRCLLVAPRTFIANHPREVEIFRERGSEVAIEHLADLLESAALNVPAPTGLRLAWRVAVLRGLTVAVPRPPDHPPTVAFSAWCGDWLAGWAPGVVPLSIRTVNQGWIGFRVPDALTYKCSHGRVDLQVSYLGEDQGLDEVRRRVDGHLPAGFEVTVDDSQNTVLRYACTAVSPQDGIGVDGEPVHASGIKDALAACVTIARWLEESGGRGLLIDGITR